MHRGIAAELTGGAELELAICFVAIGNVELVADELSTHYDGMPPKYPGEIVVEGQGVVVKVRDGVGPSADGEAAVGNLQTIRNVLIDSYTQRGRVDVIIRIATVVLAAENGDVEGVDEIVLDRPVLTHGAGIYELMLDGQCSGEDVVRLEDTRKVILVVEVAQIGRASCR